MTFLDKATCAASTRIAQHLAGTVDNAADRNAVSLLRELRDQLIATEVAGHEEQGEKKRQQGKEQNLVRYHLWPYSKDLVSTYDTL